EERGRSYEDRRIRPDHDAEEENQRELADRPATEDEEREERGQRRHARQHRPRERLVDRTVDQRNDLLTPPRRLQILADPIEDNDRVVQRVTQDRQHGGDGRQRNLEPEDRQDPERDEHIVSGRDDRSHAETPFEAERQIDQRHREREEDRERG